MMGHTTLLLPPSASRGIQLLRADPYSHGLSFASERFYALKPFLLSRRLHGLCDLVD